MNDRALVMQLRLQSKAALLRFRGSEEHLRLRGSGGRKGGHEPIYNGATFLYIRGFEGDTGARPIAAGQVFWDSPDIELFDATGVRIATNELRAEQPYTAEVTVTNDGDLDCHAGLVELFLSPPSIGFSVDGAQVLGLQTLAVPRQTRAAARIPFVATAQMAGHRCLFARVSSFVTNDFPGDLVGFDAAGDRHVAQQNLNIVPQGTDFDFDIHLLHADRGQALRLEFQHDPGTPKRMPTAAASRYFSAPGRSAGLPAATVTRTARSRAATGPIAGRNGSAQTGAHTAAAAMVGEPLLAEASSRWLLQSHLARETFRIRVPHMGLGVNEVVPLQLRLVHVQQRRVIGGITLLVLG